MAPTIRTTTAGDSRALVPAVDPPAAGGDRLHRPMAAFLTQLLAIKSGLPQTRLRCRIEASGATAVYEAQDPDHAKPPHRLCLQL
jgi:hypothetical protein